mmetsp:Transcript_23221/g.55574  ORF Transcript_23221/g.55574 Transcript_23221/m.55574 type:complete len:216 (-) Transcript_23221:2123-2770(-)
MARLASTATLPGSSESALSQAARALPKSPRLKASFPSCFRTSTSASGAGGSAATAARSPFPSAPLEALAALLPAPLPACCLALASSACSARRASHSARARRLWSLRLDAPSRNGASTSPSGKSVPSASFSSSSLPISSRTTAPELYREDASENSCRLSLRLPCSANSLRTSASSRSTCRRAAGSTLSLATRNVASESRCRPIALRHSASRCQALP